MSEEVPERFLRRFNALPVGTTTGTYARKRYAATKSVFNAGKSFKLVAGAVGDNDRISLNLYIPASGPRLCPCEMPRDRVIAFVLGYQPDAPLA